MVMITRQSSGVCLLLAGIFASASVLAPPNRAQSVSSSVTRISTSPEPVWFYVDGQGSRYGNAYNWPAGSKHTLYATPIDESLRPGVRYTFSAWQVGNQILGEGNPVTITADPSIGAISGVYNTEYGLRISLFVCEEAPCSPPGRVFVNGAPVSSSTTVWAAPGSSVVLQASPNPGNVFAGWSNNNSGQVVQGFINTVTLKEPMSVTPMFQPARSIELTTIPENLVVMADRVPLPTPRTLEWGRGSQHVLSAVSPQEGPDGHWYVFSSWNDGGAATHSYTVDGTVAPAAVVATYTPAMRVTLATSPNALKLKIDGREGLPPYNPVWGVGGNASDRSAVAADRCAGPGVWAFDGWSDGQAAVRALTVPDSAVELGMRVVAVYKQLGRVTVTSSLGAITATVDGVECKTPCSVDRPLGGTVKVSAPALLALGEGSRAEFDGWSDGTRGVAVVTAAAEPKSLVASYRTLNRLTVGAEPAEGAVCRTAPESGDGFFDSGAVVAVSLQLRAGFRFKRWEGDLAGSASPASLVMSQPRTALAIFERIPYIPPTGVRNAAGEVEAGKGVAAGSVISVVGANLAGEEVTGSSQPWPQTLGDVTVRAGDRLLPLYFVSPERITAQLPPDLPEGAAGVATRWGNQTEVKAEFQVVRNAPGLFANTVEDRAWAVAAHADGTAVSATAPARRGEKITLFGTGFGPTSPQRPWGFAAPEEIAYTPAPAISKRAISS